METFAVTGVPLPAPVAAPTAAAEEVASEAKELLPEKPAEAVSVSYTHLTLPTICSV